MTNPVFHIALALLLATALAYAEDPFTQITRQNQQAAGNALGAANQGLANARKAVAMMVEAGQGTNPAVQEQIRQIEAAQNALTGAGGQGQNYALAQANYDECVRNAQGDGGKIFACYQTYLGELNAKAPALAPQAAVQKAAADQFQAEANQIEHVYQTVNQQIGVQLQAAQKTGMPEAAVSAVVQQGVALQKMREEAMKASFKKFQDITGTTTPP